MYGDILIGSDKNVHCLIRRDCAKSGKIRIILGGLLRPPYGVPVDILAFSHKILFTEEPENISIVNIYIA